MEFPIHDVISVTGIESLAVKTTERKANLEGIINELSFDIPVYIDNTNKLFIDHDILQERKFIGFKCGRLSTR